LFVARPTCPCERVAVLKRRRAPAFGIFIFGTAEGGGDPDIAMNRGKRND